MKLDHDQIMKLCLPMSEGICFQCFNEDLTTIKPAFCIESVAPELVNLFQASVVMYQCLNQNKNAIEKMIEIAEQIGADGIVPILLQMQSSMALVQMAAVEGVQNVGNRMNEAKK